MDEFRLSFPSSHGTKSGLLVELRAVAEGNALTEANELNCFNFVCSWLALLSDSPITDSVRPLKSFTRFYKTLCHSLRDTILNFSDLAQQFSATQMLMGTSSITGEWIDGFKDTPVFFEYHRYFQTGDPVLFDFIYTFLCFGKKLEYEDETLEKVAFRNWLDVEKRLTDLKLPVDHTNNIRMIAEMLLPRLSSYEPWPKHGPGSVAERGVRDTVDKHNSLHYDRLIDRAFFTGHTAKYGFGKDSGFHIDRIIPDASLWKKGEYRRLPSRLEFAWKNMKVARSICMEPTVIMYFQQAVADMMESAIADCPLHEFIHLKDQTVNQSLCDFGSFTGTIDTLDLSSASDSVHIDLVKSIFPIDWQIFMLATRNGYALTPDGVYRLKKFAPMGSAVCFPTQCIIFSLICIYAAYLYSVDCTVASDPLVVEPQILTDLLSRISRNPCSYKDMRWNLQPLGIYGDDICCDYRITSNIIDLLSLLGFEVNKGKSFTGSQAFRESCGLFSLCGVDVTPLYYRVKGVRKVLSYSHIYSQVSIINECLQRGYVNLRKFLITSLKEWDSRHREFAIPFIPWDSSDRFGIHVWKRVDNSHLKYRYNRDLQRLEWKCLSIKSESYDAMDSLHDSYAYMRWKSSSRDRGVGEIFTAGHDLACSPRLGWRWTPAY